MRNFAHFLITAFLCLLPIDSFGQDTTAPLATLNPPTNSNNLPVEQVFTIQFNELVQTTDNDLFVSLLEPSEFGGAAVFDSMSIANGGLQLTDDGSTSILTITPTQDMPLNKSLTISVPNGLVEDLSGNPWVGTEGNGFGLAWQFTTELGDTPCTSGDIDLTITFDSFAEETSWQLTDESGTIVDSATYTSGESNTTITYQFTNLTDGVYTYTMFDSFGDGICCGQGFGSYKVSKNGIELFSGGQFGTQQYFQLCIDASIDSEVPVIACPNPITTDAGTSCSTSVAIADPTATDNVSTTFTFESARSDGRLLGDPFFVGETTINWTATDEAGNVSESCEQVITVEGTGDCWFDIGPEIVGDANEDRLGAGVSINALGDIAAYVDPNNENNDNVGEITVLQRNGGSWNPLGNMIPGGKSGRGFSGIDLNDVGNRLAVSQHSGIVSVYELNNNAWQKLGSDIPAAGEAFIQKLDFDSTGDTMIVGYSVEANSTGLAVVYELQNGQWAQLGQSLTGDSAGDLFGRDVSINSSGTRVAIGAYQVGNGAGSVQEGYVRTFELINDNWVQFGEDIKGDNIQDFFGVGVNLNDTGNRMVVGASAGKYAKVFQFEDGAWTQLGGKLAEFSTEQPGYQVDINGLGNLVLIGNFNQPGRIYQWIHGSWQLLGQPIYAGVGQDVAMNKMGNVIVMGTPEYKQQAGKVGIFEYAGDFIETEITLDANGALTISDTNGGISDDEFILSVNDTNLRIQNIGNSIVISGDGAQQIDANTVEIPLANITNGVTIDGVSGNDTVDIDSQLSLSGENNGLTLKNINARVTGTGDLQLNVLNVDNGTFDTNNLVTTVSVAANFTNSSTLIGIGSLLGMVNVDSTSSIAPGTSPGIINTGDLILANGSTFEAEVNGTVPGVDHDQIVVTGTLSIEEAILNLIGGYANAPDDEIILINNDGTDTVTGTFADLAEGAAINFGDFSGIISYVGGDGNDVVLLGNVVPLSNDLIITELMYNPGGSDTDWEWIEIYNNGSNPIDLSGYVLDDDSGTALNAANISGGMLAPQKSAVLFDADGVTEEQFQDVWGTVDLIPVTNWPTLGNGSGDSIGIWDSLENYTGDNQTQLNTIEQLVYKNNEDGWPDDDGMSSIFLIALGSDNTNGANWSLSTDSAETPLYDAYTSKELHGNSGNDIGSPGIPDSVVDNEAPIITCPEPVVMASEENSCEASFPIEFPTATDNVSDSEAITFTPTRDDLLELNDPFPVGTTMIGWIAADEAGNTSFCSQEITVNDDEAPEIICLADINIVGSSPEILEIIPATAADNCTLAPVVTFERSDNSELGLEDPFPQGSTTITWTAVDEYNNMSTCVQTVTISIGQSMANDITNFGIPNQLPGTTIDPIEKTVNLKMPVDTDLTSLTPNVSISGGASVSPETGTPQDFTDSVIYTVTAQDGSEQEWTVTVEIDEADTIPPVITCPADATVECGDGTDPADTGEATATDNSETITIEFIDTIVPGSCLGELEITRTWIATDEAENSSTCTQVITVVDTAPPVIICQADMTIAFGESTDPSNTGMATATDTCGEIIISFGDVVEGLVITRTWTALDECGNSSSCVQIITQEMAPVVLSITGFTLINADTDQPIRDLVEGEAIDINDLITQHLDIRANTTEDVESVRLSLSGALMTERTESLVPFALFRDLPLGNYIGEDFVVGQYTVSATPYSEDGLGGEMGEPFNLNFELVDSTPTLSVTSFTLINADTDEVLFDLIEGQQIDINTLPTMNLDIRANTTDDVESVRISISGELMNERTESLPPYALFQDLPIGDYMGEEFVIGEYAVSAIPYSGNSLTGDMGTPLTLNFELVDGDPACTSLMAEVEVMNPSTCGGGGSITVIPSGGTPPYDVGWIQFSSSEPTVEGLSAGFYSANVTDANGCSILVTAELADPELPEVTLEPFADVFLSDLPLALSGGMPEGGEYSGEGVTAGIFELSAPGIYEITYTYEDPETECTNLAVQEIIVKAETSNNIIAFWLVNADNEMDLFPITDGMQIDISTLPTTNLDIRAETGADTESVGFELSGTQSIMRGESLPPYALFQDLPIGDYIGHAFDLGEYSLAGTPYSQNSLQGDAGETLSIEFEFVDSTPTMAVTGFTLIDAESDGELFEMTDGMQITLDDIPSLFLDIRANTTDDVESVRLELSGEQMTERTENLMPYALFRDLPIGDYIGNNFDFGIYTVTATPYSGDNLTGEMGTPLSITFEIVDNLELNTLKISPNQATTLARASFERPTEVKQILIFDMSGRMIESYNPEYIKSGDDYILDVNFYQQGTYIVKMIDNRGVPYQKQMVVKRQ